MHIAEARPRQRFCRWSLYLFEGPYAEFAAQARQISAVQMFVRDYRVAEAVGEEVRHVRNDGFASLFFYHVYQPFVRVRVVFYEDFADDADARALHAADRQSGEVAHHFGYVLLILEPAAAAYAFLYAPDPAVVERVRRALFDFVGARAEQQAHQQVAVEEPEQRPPARTRLNLESFRFALLLAVDREHAHLREAGRVKRAAQQVDVVAGSARPAGLSVEAVGPVGVVKAALQCRDEFADDHHSWVADVVVDVAQPELDRFARALRHYAQVNAAALERALHELEVERR